MVQRELRRSVILTRGMHTEFAPRDHSCTPLAITELPVGGLIANGKYEILETLGSGSSGITYKVGA